MLSRLLCVHFTLSCTIAQSEAMYRHESCGFKVSEVAVDMQVKDISAMEALLRKHGIEFVQQTVRHAGAVCQQVRLLRFLIWTPNFLALLEPVFYIHASSSAPS